MSIHLDDCIALDANDPLAHCRQRFHLPNDKIYLDGNSLGALPKAVVAELDQAIHQEWGEDLIGSWNSAGWFELPQRLGDRIGQLIGAAAGQVVVCDNTSINLFKALHAALSINHERHRIVAHRGDFPTDLYMIEGVASSASQSVEVELIKDETMIASHFDSDVAVAVLSQVNYKTGAILDMRSVTAAAHAQGVLVIWDLCHSAGAMEVTLDQCNVDFAVGCSYKYLNSGPGAPAFVYAANRHHSQLKQPLCGWWSHADPFEFDPTYRAASGIKRMLSGTQPILSMRAIASGLDSFDGIQMSQLREKSVALCDLFIKLVGQFDADYGIDLIGPADSTQRGSHVSLAHQHGYAIVRAMIDRGVIGDFRAPNLMRFGFAPLYIQFEQVWRAVDVMRQCIEQHVWLNPTYQNRSTVT